MPVRLRSSKSPSPASERPKSDSAGSQSVRWADLMEARSGVPAAVRRGDGRGRTRPRPKSDIGRSRSLKSEYLLNFSYKRAL